jgi:hypothetical protein
LNAKWPLNDRNHEKAQIILANKNESEIILGYKKEAIVNFIPFENAVVDTLHMGLRITDKLLKQLLLRLEELDGDSSIDLLKRPLLKNLWDFIEYE